MIMAAKIGTNRMRTRKPEKILGLIVFSMNTKHQSRSTYHKTKKKFTWRKCVCVYNTW